MAQYRLTRTYFDGVPHERGSIMEFEEGKQPSSAILVSGEVAPAETPDADDPLLTPDEPVLDFGGDDLSTLSQITAKQGDKKK